MQFKHPELLYALFFLLIPIIIHLFKLRRFQKEYFTNVAFLKAVNIQTRKSSQIKKFLVLCTRLLLLAAIIIAFAQPYKSKLNTLNTNTETVIYLDNSHSMQSKGENGELLKRAIQDIISNVNEDENVSIITNNNAFKNTTIKSIKNELLQLDYSPLQLSYASALLKSKSLFNKNNESKKNLIFISDFQQKEEAFSPETDTLISLNVVQLKPINTSNVSIDSVYISRITTNTIELTANIKSTNNEEENVSVSLYNDEKLIAKTSVNTNQDTNTSFSIPNNEVVNGRINIDDTNLQFDNKLYFNINETPKINVLSISHDNDNAFLERIFTPNEFNYTWNTFNQINFNTIDKQNLIVLNEINNIPNALATTLKAFTDNGGSLVIIPSKNAILSEYNSLLVNYGMGLTNFNENEKLITTINFSHLLFNDGVFEKRVSNFQYPKANSYYNVSSGNYSTALQFEDASPFLMQRNNAYVFSAPINNSNSNFIDSPLIVPTLYNIGKQSLKVPKLYYEIGKQNTFDINYENNENDILSLANSDMNIIPLQRYYNNKVSITTNEMPNVADIYLIKNKEQSLEKVSYNYDRSESDLTYQNISELKNITINNSVTELLDNVKSNTKVNELWKWFVIFALAFLIIEMLILKYFK